jgi:hypothetical protein
MMMRILLLAAFLLLTACKSEFFAWNEKLTVVIETPTGNVLGEAVYAAEVEFWGKRWAMANQQSSQLYGEAIPITLSDGRVLFVLKASGGRAEGAFQQELNLPGPSLYRAISASEDRAPRPIASYSLPDFAWFPDPSDPESLTLIDPQNLAQTFGPGHALREVSIALTDEPVTYGRIDGLLPWTGKPTDIVTQSLEGHRTRVLSDAWIRKKE